MTRIPGPKHQPAHRSPRKAGQALSTVAHRMVEGLESRVMLADSIAPTAQLVAATRDTTGVGYNIQVTYRDENDLDTTTLDSTDIRVTGPGSYNQQGTFISLDNNTKGLRTVTYRVPNPLVFGTYTITIQNRAVADAPTLDTVSNTLTSNYVATGTLGVFQAGLNTGGGGGAGPSTDFDPPDIVPVVLATPTKAATLQPATITYRISNLGNFDSPENVFVDVYASTDPTLDVSDTLATRQNIGKIDGGESKKVKLKLVFPDVLAGNYYIILKADPDNIIAEKDETNNVAVSPAQVPVTVPFIDLAPTIIGSLPNQVVGGDSGKVEVRIDNFGTATFDRTANISLFVSADQILDSSDSLAQTLVDMPLKVKADSHKNVKIRFNYPTNVIDGSYYLIVKTDVGTEVLDPVSSNDVDASEERVLILAPFIDLRADQISITSGPIARDGNKAKVQISNLGNVPVEGPIAITLSAVANDGSGTVTPITTVVPRLSLDGTNLTQDSVHKAKISIKFDLPPALAAGSYFFRATVDSNAAYAERNETNNEVTTVNPFPVPSAPVVVPPTSSNYASTVLGDGPTGYWRLGEAAGATTMFDSTSNNLNGSYIGPVALGATGAIAGDPNTALGINGVQAFGSVPDQSALHLGSDYTLEAWVFQTSQPSQFARVVGKGAENGVRDYGLFISVNGNLLLQEVDANSNLKTQVLSTGALTTGRWQHVVAVAEGSTVTFYIDGQIAGSGSRTPGDAPTSSAPLAIGYAGFLSSPNASLDEVAIYNKALSATRIAAHYNSGLGLG